jgi:hypothetical protein
MNFTDPSTLCLIVLALSAVFLLIHTRGQLARQRRRWEAEATAAGAYDAAAKGVSFPPGCLPDDLARWEVEMHETARQLSAQLDAKLGLLQSLIAEADRAAARLEEALDRAHPTLPPGSPAESLRPAAGHARDLQEDFETAADANSSTAGEDPRMTDRARRREEVYRLADYGFSVTEIARRAGLPVGEVELMLSLRESK